MGHSEIEFVDPDDGQLAEFDRLVTRSFGHPVADVTGLRPHASTRVAVRDGSVVAGGLGLLLDQYFGGRPVPSACLAAGCVAPEERGDRLAARMVADRVRVLQEQCAVISTVWTKGAGYAHHLGWEAVTPVFAWSISTDELRRSFPDNDIRARHGLPEDAVGLCERLAASWNGPVRRPDWWWGWKQTKNNLTPYTFAGPDGAATGFLSLATKRHERHGMRLEVHDFWAADSSAAEAMYGFLGRFETRAEQIDFRRGVLPPDPLLLQRLNRHRMTAAPWHSWMIRLLDIPAALRLRGWPADLATTLILEVIDGGPQRFALHLQRGQGDVDDAGSGGPQITLTRRQLAAWYAGAYRSTSSARAAGIQAASLQTLVDFIGATVDLEPWMPDHF